MVRCLESMLIGYTISYDKKKKKKNECVVSTADDETILYIASKNRYYPPQNLLGLLIFIHTRWIYLLINHSDNLTSLNWYIFIWQWSSRLHFTKHVPIADSPCYFFHSNCYFKLHLVCWDTQWFQWTLSKWTTQTVPIEWHISSQWCLSAYCNKTR